MHPHNAASRKGAALGGAGHTKGCIEVVDHHRLQLPNQNVPQLWLELTVDDGAGAPYGRGRPVGFVGCEPPVEQRA